MTKSITGFVSISFLGGIVGRGFRYGFNVVIARGLGPEALGVFAFGLVLMKMSSVIARVGLDNAAQKFVPIYQANDDEEGLMGLVLICLGVPFVLGTILSLVLYSQRRWILAFTNDRFGSIIFLFLLGIPLISVLMVGRAATLGFKETKYAVYIRDIGQSGVGILLIAIGAYVISDVVSVVTAYLFSLVVGVVLTMVFLRRQGAFRWSGIPSFHYREIFSFALPLTVVAVTQNLASWTDVLMLARFVEPRQVGWYQAVYQTSILLILVLEAINTIFPSVASDLYHKGRHELLDQVYTAVTKWLVYFAVLGYVFLVIYLDPILGLFGASNSAARQALLILGLGQALTVSAGPVGFMLSMTGHERLMMANTVSVLIVNLVLNFVLIQSLGIVGAAIATSVAFVLLSVVRLLEVWYLHGMQPYSTSYWRGLVAVGCALPVLYFGTMLPLPGLVQAFIGGCLGLGLFLAIMWQFGLETRDTVLLRSLD